jgi:phosphoserine aminotransferase
MHLTSMISFYPGPSRVHDEIPRYVNDAYKLGIMSINHRSAEFMKISEKTIRLLKEKLGIPKKYTVFYTSSATECWEIIAQSLVTEKSYHLYSGSFGQKWYEYTKRLKPGAEGFAFSPEKKINPKDFIWTSGQVICVTHNETSNGTRVDNTIISAIKKNNPQHLVAVDATSSMGGVTLNFRAADIWLASVQKCFGLPAGLGIMICSPQVMDAAFVTGEKLHYNSLTFMAGMMEKWQTPFTPNVLGIYLLMRVMEKAAPIKASNDLLVKRYNDWLLFLGKRKSIRHLIDNSEVHSHTVIPVAGTAEAVSKIKKLAKERGILLGEGYGDLKSTTFRIANFPAIKKNEIDFLKRFLSSF